MAISPFLAGKAYRQTCIGEKGLEINSQSLHVNAWMVEQGEESSCEDGKPGDQVHSHGFVDVSKRVEVGELHGSLLYPVPTNIASGSILCCEFDVTVVLSQPLYTSGFQ